LKPTVSLALKVGGVTDGENPEGRSPPPRDDTTSANAIKHAALFVLIDDHLLRNGYAVGKASVWSLVNGVGTKGRDIDPGYYIQIEGRMSRIKTRQHARVAR
jgi:hypothetical protein